MVQELFANLRIGTAGWSDAHWAPKGRGHALERVAESFDTAEITESFSAPLKPEVSSLWARKVESNPRFRFTAKLHRQFSHDRQLDPALVNAWKAGLQPLRKSGRLGAVLMQFPWSFKFTQENKNFLIRLRRTFHEFPLAAEMRHDSWSLDEALGVFIDYKIGFCNIDQPRFVRAMPPSAYVTAGTAYVRLHGRNSFQWFGSAGKDVPMHRYDYLYSEAELAEWAKRIKHLAAHAAHTYVIANNDAGPKAAVNAAQLQAMLGLAAAPVMTPSKPMVQAIPLFQEFSGTRVA